MATTPASGFLTNNALAVKHWSAQIYQQALADLYFTKYIGKGPDSLIQEKFDLTKEKGDSMTFGLLMKMTGAGVTGDTALENAEESLAYYNYSQLITLRANAVVAAGKMTLRMTAMDIKRDAKTALGGWLKEILEQDIIYALSGLVNGAGTIAKNAPSTNRKWFGGQASGGATIEAVANDAAIDSTTNNLFGPQVISILKRKAQMATPKIRPLVVNGKEYYVIFIHPYQAKALKADADWKNAQLYAADRGSNNPIFTGALGIYDQVIVQEHNGIITKIGGGAGAAGYFESDDLLAGTYTVARALFCGAQAGVIGWGQMPGWYEKMFQYNRVPGVATDVVYGIGKPEFNSEDFAVITCDTMAIPDA